MLRNERRIAVRSGELIVGVLNRATHGTEHWSWSLTGGARPHDDPEFAWHGIAETEGEAFDALAACWSRWLDWAGIESGRHVATGREAMNRPRRINYDRKLARRIVLADGTHLETLKDAADLLANRFATVTKWGALEHCIELLMRAARPATSRLSRRRPIRSR